ncbi:MAG: PEP-CTERM sorting domain-containing protein [Planctomycetes bacterium]|nr:PEP-CTERM sorting domain-containing protein [Planctomycetota bacterium]
MTKMKAFVGGALVLALGASTVFAAATANFTPTSPTSVTAGTPITVDISISKSGGLNSFDFANIAIGSTDPVFGLSFGFNPDWQAAFAFPGVPVIDSVMLPAYTRSVSITSDNDPFGIGDATLALGTVTIDTTAMAPGLYDIRISNATDGGFSELVSVNEGGGAQDPIEGLMGFEIVPEPATAFLMLLGGSCLFRKPIRQN